MTEQQPTRGYRHRPIISGVIWLGLGLYLLAIKQGLVPSIDDSWPVLIIIVGLAIIIGAFRRHHRPGISIEMHHDNSGGSSGKPSV